MRPGQMMLLVCLAGLAVADQAAANGVGIAGKWARSPSQCGRPQSSPSAPVVISGRRLDQHEAHCTFRALRSAGAGRWTGRGSCSIEGDVTKGRFAFKLRGALLTVTYPDGNALTYRRC